MKWKIIERLDTFGHEHHLMRFRFFQRICDYYEYSCTGIKQRG